MLGAVALIVLGALVMAPRSSRQVEIDDTDIGGVVVLGARRFIATSPAVHTGDITVVGASGVVDLSGAGIAPGARMKVTVLLGGCDVVIPQGWGVRLSGLPLLGSWDNTTRRDLAVDPAQTLEVHATVILGGLEVRHTKRWS